MKINEDDFGSLCVFALRYCEGRQTYAPELVIGIVVNNLKSISDKTLAVMLSDLEYQRRMDRYGDIKLDKPLWIAFEKHLLAEREERKCQS